MSIKESIKRWLGIKSPSEYYTQQPSGLVEGMNKPEVRYVCLDCDHSRSEPLMKEEYEMMKLCPKCGGKYVDILKANIIVRAISEYGMQPSSPFKTNSITDSEIIVTDTNSSSCDSSTSDVGCSND
ncbi:hypothetical protein [Bacillus sp. Hm123]|uniref:hypothetical protein n=1 Tax=Bacillus sp. Hm123 TaxID=3450745 RepID=UPI003F43BFD4